MKTAPAPEAPARPAPGAVPSAEPSHGPVDAAEDSLDGLQTAFGALSVEEVVSQPQPVKRKRENESEEDAGGEADEGEEQGQDLTHDPTFEGAPSASGLHASPSSLTTTLPAAATSTSTTNPPMAEGTGFTGMPPYAAYGMGPPTTALHEATTASEPVVRLSPMEYIFSTQSVLYLNSEQIQINHHHSSSSSFIMHHVSCVMHDVS